MSERRFRLQSPSQKPAKCQTSGELHMEKAFLLLSNIL